MENALQHSAETLHLKFVGKMTHEVYRELEVRVSDAMRRSKKLEVDLSGIEEIDLCGLHLVGLLQSEAVIVGCSPVVERASRRLLTTLHKAALGRAARRHA